MGFIFLLSLKYSLKHSISVCIYENNLNKKGEKSPTNF